LSANGQTQNAERLKGLPVRGVVLGLLGSVFIWLATPYVNFVLRVGFIADGQLPVGVVFVTCVLVLLVNPLLCRLDRRIAFRYDELATAVGIMLIASIPASGGLLRMLVHSLARVPSQVSTDRHLAELYARLNLPPSLFPDRIAYGVRTPASEYFLDRLPSGASIPWRNWLPPLLSWGPFILFSFCMMLSLGLITLRQWRDNERLPFPLIAVQQNLIEEPEPGRCLAPIFCRRSFLTAAGVVFVLHFLGGAAVYAPESVPAIPLEFDIRRLFTAPPFVYLPYYIWHNRIYFTFIALAYFMPNRVSVSIWFWQLAYALYTMYARAYAPPFYPGSISHHRSGAMMTVAVVILWLGRRRWIEVGRTLFRAARTTAEQRDRFSGWMFLIGCAGMIAWFRWAGTPLLWGAALTAMAVIASLVTARMVAETGLIQVWLYESQIIDFARLIPGALYTPTAAFFVGIVGVIFGNGGRVSAPAMMAHAAGLDRSNNPTRRKRLLATALPIIAAAVVIGGAAHLTASYRNATSLDGKWRPLTPWGSSQFEHSHRLLRYWEQDAIGTYAHNKYLHFGAGVLLAGVCEWMCLRTPAWPIHPVGLLIVQQWHANLIWFSVFLGWALKVLLVRYGGARLYRQAVPAVFGLIVGELLAGVFWMLVGMVWLWLGREFRVVPIIPY